MMYPLQRLYKNICTKLSTLSDMQFRDEYVDNIIGRVTFDEDAEQFYIQYIVFHNQNKMLLDVYLTVDTIKVGEDFPKLKTSEAKRAYEVIHEYYVRTYSDHAIQILKFMGYET